MPTILDKQFFTPIYEHTPRWEEVFLIQSEIDAKWPEMLATDTFENPLGWEDGVMTNIKKRRNSIKDYELKNLGAYIEKHVRNYIKVSEAWEYKDIFLSDSWANYTINGAKARWHQHHDSVVSGVYYYKTTGNDGNIMFKTPNPYINLESFPIGEQVHKYVTYTPSIGKIIIFPGWLEHEVEPNNSSEPRISFSFNYLYDNDKDFLYKGPGK
jgi:uncharacterized protein (TIGR02466 family)